MENKEMNQNKKNNKKKYNTVEKTNCKLAPSNKNKNSYTDYFREKNIINSNKINLEVKSVLSPRPIRNDKKALSPKFPKNNKTTESKNYIDRINNSRKTQKQKEEMLNPDYNKLYDKLYMKKNNSTVIDKNKKLTKKQYDKYINAFHNALMSED